MKTDRRDADVLAKLSASGQLRTVQVPDARVRQWRVRIDYRSTLVQRRTRLKNHLKAILRNRGLATGKLWTSEGMARLRSLSRPMDGCPVDALWRGELAIELAQFDEIETHLRTVMRRLDALVQICPMAQKLLAVCGFTGRR